MSCKGFAIAVVGREIERSVFLVPGLWVVVLEIGRNEQMNNSEFDTVIDRRGTGSLKWNRYTGRDIIPVWIADMDFQVPLPVRQAIHRYIDFGVLGYADVIDGLNEAVVEKLKVDFGWEIDASWIIWSPGLVPALNVACCAVGADGDEIVTFTPIYPPFLNAPENARKKLIEIPLCHKDGSYTFDIEEFEQSISPKTRLVMLCNPHNPVGRVYKKKELEAIAEICLKNNIIMCSDEIFCDLILDEKKHIPIATLSDRVAGNTITFMASCKTYNLGGLNCGYVIIPNEKIREKFLAKKTEIISRMGILGFAATLAAYTQSSDWREKLLEYLRQNRNLVTRYINEEIPALSMDHVEATFLAWIDARKLKVPDPVAFFENAGVGMQDGREFHGDGFVRLNFGSPRKTLLKVLNRMKTAVKKHLKSLPLIAIPRSPSAERYAPYAKQSRHSKRSKEFQSK